MLLMSCTNVSRGYDATPLFEGVGFELHAGERVGFVGPNGAGKTTLLKVLSGEEYSDTGEVKLHAGARLGVLQQVAEFPPGRTLFSEAKSAFDELLAAQQEMVQVADELAHTTDEGKRKQLSAQFDRLNETLRSLDAYELDHKIEAVLSGLGFAAEDFHREVITFSGGQQRRLLLAKLLLSAPDVMLLDEPSNHLDIATTRWLEEYLARQPQGMLVVSHDRYFLDKISTKIFELHNKKITSYPGNYTRYVKLRDEKFEREMKEWTAQQEFVEKQEEYIRRVNYGQLAKQAQSRAKVLEKLERVDKPTKVAGPNIRFDDVVRTGEIVFRTEDLCKSFGPLKLFENLNFDLPRGKRLGIVGANGSGKTTLLKILLGLEDPTSGRVQRGAHVHTGYLDQHLALLPEDKTVLRAVWPDPTEELTEQVMRDLLSRFGLQGKIVEQTIGSLSGGERSRAALAKLTVTGVNVLVLDEPTNHLDLWACDSLEEALKAFEGTVVVVSHDRYFLNRVVDLMIVFEDNKTEVVYGNYTMYEALRANRIASEPKAKPAEKEKPASVNTGEAKKKKRKFPFRKVKDLEADIATVESKIAYCELALQDVELYKDKDKFRQTLTELESMKEKLPGLYEHWEEAVELNG